MCKKRIMVYPYDKEMVPILKYNEKFVKHEIADLISPSGWGYVGKDAGEITYGNKLGISIQDDFYGAMNRCDTVLFNKSRIHLDYEKEMKSKIQIAIEQNKNIICFCDLSIEQQEEIALECSKKGLQFDYYNNHYEIESSDSIEKSIRMSEFESSIIFVMGMTEDTDKFSVQLALRNNFIKAGYKVSQIGTRSYCQFLGFHSIPDFMFSHAVKDYEKVLLFNRFVKTIEEKESPDVIIIGIPGGILPISNMFPNKFGITAFEISRAIMPDITVLCTHFSNYDENYFNNIEPLLKYRFNAEVDCYYINNTIIDFLNQDIQNDISLVNVIPSKVEKEVKRLQDKGINAYSSTDNIFLKIEELLKGYSSVYLI